MAASAHRSAAMGRRRLLGAGPCFLGPQGKTAQGQGATRPPCTGPQTSLFPSPFLRTRRNKQETALHGSLCVHNLNAASPNTLPLFPSHVGASKTSTKKGKRAGRLLVTKAEKQTATSVP